MAPKNDTAHAAQKQAQAEQAKADRLAAAIAAFRQRTSSAALFPKK